MTLEKMTLDNLLEAEVSKMCNQSKKSRTVLLVQEMENGGYYHGSVYTLSRGQVQVKKTHMFLYSGNGGGGKSVKKSVVTLNDFLTSRSRRDLFEIYENLNDWRSYQK